MKKDKTMPVDMILVKKPVKGISLNGDEFLLDDKNKIKKFYTIKSAKMYLKSKGFMNFNGVDFVKESDLKQ